MFDYDYCILGAGPSGLVLTYRLLQAGKRVLLIERDSRVGGLAKSHCYGEHIFDTGPKRFHTGDEMVLSFVKEVNHGLSKVNRSTWIYFLDKYFNWPLTLGDIFKLPAPVIFRSFRELLSRTSVKDRASFHDYVNVRYGEELYQRFFKPYTEKFLRWDPEDIHSDWAATSIENNMDDRRRVDKLMDILKYFILPGRGSEFLYPTEGGFGGFYEKLVELCKSYPNFHISLTDTVIDLKAIPNGLELTTASGRQLTSGDLIWTGNLNHLLKIISQQGHVHYLNTIFYNLICSEKAVLKKGAQWVYVSRGNTLISRITCMKEFAPYTSPQGYYNLICEVTDNQINSRYMNNPSKYVQEIIGDLRAMSFVGVNSSPDAVHINPVMDTYPIYHRNYYKDFGSAKSCVKGFSKHIHLLGRSGAFWYNNSDHSIRFALEMARRLLSGDERPFDYRNYFGAS